MTQETKLKQSPTPNRYTLVVLVDNERGVLSRISGMFAARGYNIDSLTVAAINANDTISRINIATLATQWLVDQIVAQLRRLIPVRGVWVMPPKHTTLEREIALVKVMATNVERRETLRIAQAMGATVIDTTLESFIFEITSTSEIVTSFIQLMRKLGQTEVARSGVVAMQRGSEMYAASLGDHGTVENLKGNERVIYYPTHPSEQSPEQPAQP